MGVVRRLRCMDTRGRAIIRAGTGHHTVPLNLATDISKLPIVGIGVSILL